MPPSLSHRQANSIPKNTPDGKSESPIASRTDIGGGACGETISPTSITAIKQIGGILQILATHLTNEAAW